MGFFLSMKRLYFDTNATTPLAPPVISYMREQMEEEWGNPSSSHLIGRKAKRTLEEAREILSEHLDCNPEEIFFTSGATESNNMVFHTVGLGETKGQIVLSSLEHDAVFKPAQYLASQGHELKFLNITSDGNFLEEDWIFKSNHVALVSIMLANNEVGIVLPVKELALKSRQSGFLVHTDCACALGKMKVSFRNLGVDYLSLSAHKFYGPKGVGALLVRKGAPLVPLLWGGGQERGFRSGTTNPLAAMAMAKALIWAEESLDLELSRLLTLRNQLKKGLAYLVPNAVFVDGKQQLPQTLNILFPKVQGQTLLAALDLEGVSASQGSACQTGAAKTSRVLLALGYSEDIARGAIRLSFGKMTTGEDVEELLKRFEKVLKRIIE